VRLLEAGAIEHLGLDQGLSRKPPGAVLSAPVFLVHKKGPKEVEAGARPEEAQLSAQQQALQVQGYWNAGQDGWKRLVDDHL